MLNESVDVVLIKHATSMRIGCFSVLFHLIRNNALLKMLHYKFLAHSPSSINSDAGELVMFNT